MNQDTCECPVASVAVFIGVVAAGIILVGLLFNMVL
jgi:hypothetical protein